MKRMAEKIFEDYEGKIPKNADALRKLPRVGDYVANAVLVFAHGEPLPLLDVNVRRVLERLFSISSDEKMEEKLREIMPKTSKVKEFYYGLVDLGGTICLKTNPRCDICPLQDYCSHFDT